MSVAPAQQSTTEHIPVIVNVTLSTTPCISQTPWDITKPCIPEERFLYVCVDIVDVDWIQDPNATTTQQEQQGVALTMRSFWLPFFYQGLEYGPEPPPITTDRTGAFTLDFYYFPPPVVGDEIQVQVAFLVPKLGGPNQARLRSLIDYDALWFVELAIRNVATTATTIDPNAPASRDYFDVCGIANPALAPGNPPPHADAGPDQTVAFDPRTGQVVVHLDGSRTFDGSNVGFNPALPGVFDKDTLQFTWEWISGPVRADPGPDSSGDPAKAQVTLEVPTPDNNPYVFRLLVEDGTNALPSADETRVFVRTALPVNHAPRAKIAGPSGPVPVGGIIRLDGSVSQDTDGDQLTYLWAQTNEVGGELAPDQLKTGFQPLSGLTAAVSTWQAVTEGTFYFRLLVTDQPALRDPVLAGKELTSAAMVTVQVSNTAASGAQMAAVRDGQPDAGAPAPQPAPAGCGTGLVALGLVPPGLWLMRGRRRQAP